MYYELNRSYDYAEASEFEHSRHNSMRFIKNENIRSVVRCVNV